MSQKTALYTMVLRLLRSFGEIYMIRNLRELIRDLMPSRLSRLLRF